MPDAALADLRERLARTRWPDEPPLAPWSSGTSVAYLKTLVEYWQNGFDWRAQEARLNALPQYTVPIRGIDVHFIHVPGTGRNPMPLLLAHGWPGSVLEFLKLIPLLREQFTIVAPSLPGYA
ncbi:MAG: epoxide hydrolase 1, partial [Betaproteobacteria bacterium]|nr:epoxide hydrolase 1 [Betaproteobacteria bacterium]